MAIIGLNDSTGTGTVTEVATGPQRTMDGYGVYTAEANQEVYKVGLFSGNATSGSVEVGFRDITDGVNNAPLIASEIINITAANTLHEVNLSTAEALTEGRLYAAAWRIVSDTSLMRTYSGGACSDSTADGTVALESLFTDSGGGISQRYVVYAETQTAAGGASITDVDTDNVLTDGQTGVVANISGFTTPPDSGKLVSGAFEYALTNFSSNATTATFDIQDIANLSGSQAGVPFSSASHSLTLVLENSVDVESASIAITLNPATGRAVQELTGVNNATNGCVTKNFTGTPPNTSQIDYVTASNTSLDAQALLTTDIINGTINMRYWDAVTGIWEPFTVTLVNGAIASISFARDNVSSSIKSQLINTIKGSVRQ